MSISCRERGFLLVVYLHPTLSFHFIPAISLSVVKLLRFLICIMSILYL